MSDVAEQSVRHRRMQTEPNKDERLLAWVYHWSLTTTKTDARRLRRKNMKVLRLAIEQPERKAKGDFTNSRAIIDACKPFYWKDQYPKVNQPSPEIRRLARQKFGHLLK